MIVKDEEQDIKRCLDSVAPYIDYWVISDTGSKDRTMELIQEIMDGHKIPGELRQDAWKDFSSNRNIVLEEARKKADFVWFMDADDNFVSESDNPFASLNPDYKCMYMRFNIHDHDFNRLCIVNSKLDWKYHGVLHEVLLLDGKSQEGPLVPEGKVIARSSPTKRAESKEKKYANDAKILLKEHKKDPKNTRTIFYLAQSYRDSKQLEKSLKYYLLRLEYPKDGYVSELEVAAIEACKIMCTLKRRTSECLFMAMKAWGYNPFRPEPPILAMEALMNDGMWFQAFTIGDSAARVVDDSKVHLFISKYEQDVRLKSHYALCCYKIGMFEMAYKNQESILDSPYLPEEEREEVTRRLNIYKKNYEQSERNNADDVEVQKD